MPSLYILIPSMYSFISDVISYGLTLLAYATVVTSAEGLVTSELTRFYRANGTLFGVGEVNEMGAIKAQKTFILDD